jgi:hypothetical protein
MGPGLPGIALGGLFYLLLALAGPIVEGTRALRGRSTAASRRMVARHFALAVSMLVALDLTYRAAALLVASPAAAPAEGVVALPITPVLVGVGMLLLVLALTKLADLGLRYRPTAGQRRQRQRIARALEATGD